jgi:hypothetical protein
VYNKGIRRGNPMNTPKMTMKRKRSASKYTKEELRRFYEEVAHSSKVSESKKTYRRSRKAKREAE